jgi:hypothetical protein
MTVFSPSGSPNVPGWKEADASPVSPSGSKVDIDLSDAEDYILISARIDSTTSGVGDWEMTFNNATGAGVYTYVDNADTINTSASSMVLRPSAEVAYGLVAELFVWNQADAIGCHGDVGYAFTDDGAGTFVHGTSSDNAPNSVQISHPSGGFQGTVEVFHR